MRLLDAIASSLDVPPELGGTSDDGLLLKARKQTSKPVLQFSQYPMSVDSRTFANARSDSNPSGDLRSLFAFRQLVDPVPELSERYFPGIDSTEATYGQILRGASVQDESAYTGDLIASSAKQFEERSFSNMDGSPGSWRPIYAVPDDWWDPSKVDRYQTMDLDLETPYEESSSYLRIGEARTAQLSTAGDVPTSTPLDPRTTLRSISLKCQVVTLRRPWFNSMLFESAGWYLSRQPEGFCSSGTVADNDGVLPLLPIGMLLARDISIDAAWAGPDQAVIDAAHAEQKPVFVGPLPLQSNGASTNVQIIAWISSLVPFSPQASDLRRGAVVVRNTGAFVARFSMSWTERGKGMSNTSGSFRVLSSKTVPIPADARDISLKVEIMTFPSPLETWATVATRELPLPAEKFYEVSGSTLAPKFKEIPAGD
ncbi:MAG: hypothetical protein ACR2KK_18625 [Acidimicrobiales bacterium]